MTAPDATADPPAALATYATVEIGDQLFGIPIEHVLDVFVVTCLTRVPLAPPEIAGLVNLRGRVLTMLDMRQRLGLPARPDQARRLAVGIEHRGESFGLIVDAVGDVMQLAAADLEPNPVHLDRRWAQLSRGIHPLSPRLLVVMDVEAALAPDRAALAA